MGYRKEFIRNTSENLIKRTILFFAGDNSLHRFLDWFNGYGLRSDDQRSEDSAIRFSPASLTNSRALVYLTDVLQSAIPTPHSAMRRVEVCRNSRYKILVEYLTERSTFFNAWSEFSCPDWCERFGCKEPKLHISISLVDLIAVSVISGKKPSDLFKKDCKIGFDPIDQGQPWVGRISIELKNPFSFLDGKECSVYPGRPIACALFPEYSFIGGNREDLLKKDLFRNFPCIQNPCSISPRRREIVQFLFEMLIQEIFLSDFYLFGLSPFVLDLKSIAGEGLGGVHVSAGEKAKIPHQQMEGLISQRLGKGGYFDAWEAKVEQLDRANGRNRFVQMKHWTDQMMATQDRISSGIAYQFEGNRLLPIRLNK